MVLAMGPNQGKKMVRVAIRKNDKSCCSEELFREKESQHDEYLGNNVQTLRRDIESGENKIIIQ